MSWGWGHYPPKPKPRKTTGGLRLRTKSGGIADTWWGKRWIEALESFGWHTRLERGRRYARQGQVASLRMESGAAHAHVQGSRPKPYEVKISLHAFSRKDWAQAADALARTALYSAKLLAGEMPHEIEQVFREIKLPLFPESKRDLSTDCSCPDWENPCKHIAATYYILAQEFDRDPFLLFKMRGISRDELLAAVRTHRREAPVPHDPDGWREKTDVHTQEKRPSNSEKASTKIDLSLRLHNFYRIGKDIPKTWQLEPNLLERIPKPGNRIREMGPLPFWQSEYNFEPALVRIYQAVRAYALAVAFPQSDIQK